MTSGGSVTPPAPGKNIDHRNPCKGEIRVRFVFANGRIQTQLRHCNRPTGHTGECQYWLYNGTQLEKV